MTGALPNLADNTADFPTGPGVYLMKDAKARIIYVGKAKNLKNRVRQYFGESDTRAQVKFLMQRVADIDFIATRTESEALLLENSLIKKHKPKYNIFLKDDKTYLGLKLTVRDNFPRLIETRRIKKDGAAYYGPFTSAESLREVREFIGRFFQLRTCNDREFATRTRPCLEYQIKRCSAPCVGYVASEAYAGQIRAVRLFLEGKNRDLQTLLITRMESAAHKLDFEEAARLRDLLKHMTAVLEKQSVTRLSFDFMDVLALERAGEKSAPISPNRAGLGDSATAMSRQSSDRGLGIAVLMVRDGGIIDSRFFILSGLEDDAEALANFITQYYTDTAFIPREIVLPIAIGDADALAVMLSQRAGFAVAVRVVRRGERRELMALARQNLLSHFDRKTRAEADRNTILQSLAGKLELESPPRRIECFDTSHISGTNAVAAQVTFVDGEPFKNGYRRYRLQREAGNDDYALMREVLSRRFAPLPSAPQPPELLIVDGGKGHIHIAVKVLGELNVTGVAVIGIAKGRGPGTRARGQWEGKKEDEVYLPGRKNPLKLKAGTPELTLLQRIRDEAHRFAITYHRGLRARSLTRSWLDDIPGIGSARKRELLKTFGSPAAAAKAGMAELLRIPGITTELAEKIALHRNA